MTIDVPALPPLIRKMLGRLQKQRRKSPIENNSTQVSKVGRKMTYTKCWKKVHKRKHVLMKHKQNFKQ